MYIKILVRESEQKTDTVTSVKGHGYRRSNHVRLRMSLIDGNLKSFSPPLKIWKSFIWAANGTRHLIIPDFLSRKTKNKFIPKF